MVNDWDAFQSSLYTEGPDAFRVNGWKTDVNSMLSYFRTHTEFDVEPSPHLPNLFYARHLNHPVSKTLLHWAGHFYIQDPVTLLPVMALDLTGGETVLDLCAAPGGKTLQLSETVGPRGTVVANEPLGNRRKILNSNIQRLGAPNVNVTGYEGQSIPESRQFDRILADVPCTGEGNYHVTGQTLNRASDGERSDIVERQFQILKKAYTVLEPGGEIVYSTCSYAPEENEAVVDRLLTRSDARLVPVALDGPHDSGVTEWQSETYHAELDRVWRCYPHHYDGGGLVFTKISKPQETRSNA